MRPVYARSGSRGEFIEFNGRSSKTYKGGLKDMELAKKNTRHYCQDGKVNYVSFVYEGGVRIFSFF